VRESAAEALGLLGDMQAITHSAPYFKDKRKKLNSYTTEYHSSYTMDAE
jgi:hypothetical protein